MWPERKIEFEVSDELLELGKYTAQPGQLWPKWAVTFAVAKRSGWTRKGYRGGESCPELTDALLQTLAAAHLSDRQRRFVEESVWLVERSDRAAPSPRGLWFRVYAVYAVSEDDARHMAAAAVELLDQPRKEDFEKARQAILDTGVKLPQLQGDFAEAHVRRLKAWEEYESAYRAAPYENREAAIRDLERLEDALRAVDVTIAGINAKMATIRRLKDERGDQADETMIMLDRLLIEQDVELAGALARREAVTEHRARTLGYLQKRNRYYVSTGRVVRLREYLTGLPGSLHRWRRTLEDPSNACRPIELHGPVRVYQIKYAED